jgi:hypothetical protein
MLLLPLLVFLGSVAAPAAGLPPLPLHSLALAPSEFPGLRRDRLDSGISATAKEWAAELGERGKAAEAEQRVLQGEEFEEGLYEYFGGHPREGVYTAMVFAADAGAERQLAESVAGALAEFPVRSRSDGEVLGVPGGREVGEYLPKRRDAIANVFFAVGRCMFVTADSAHDTRGASQGIRPAETAARRAYRRALHLCS